MAQVKSSKHLEYWIVISFALIYYR
jgi:hypothetical protein